MFPRNDSLPSGLVESLEQFGSNERDRSEALEKFSDVQLLEWCRRLGLQGLSSLSKSQLARRLLQTIAARSGERDGESDKRAQELAVREQAERSREPQAIPWGYDKNRVTAAAVDPRRLFVYWELRDDALASARTRLAGGDTWLNLRVYDTTERLFDGTNANSYFDQRVERHDRQWFFEIGKPSSTAVVELGVKDNEGHFVVVCRSGRVDFPRNRPVDYGAPEWMLVKASSGAIEQRRTDDARSDGHGGGGPGAAPGAGGSEPPWGDWQPGEEPFAAWRPSAAGELRWVRQWRDEEPGVVWEEFFGEGGETIHRSVTWQDATTAESWESGPFSYPVQVMPPTYETFEAPGHAWRVGEQVHVLHGPWQVVIRGLGSYVGRRVVSRWEVYRSWSQVTRVERGELGGGAAAAVGVGSSERYLGASMGQSELRFRGASEVFFLGASERRLGGSSEYAYRGASERRLGGASESRLIGGSEGRLGGASDRHASAPYEDDSVSWATIAVPLADDDIDIPWNVGESETSSGRK